MMKLTLVKKSAPNQALFQGLEKAKFKLTD
jgi:hypothetical protein